MDTAIALLEDRILVAPEVLGEQVRPSGLVVQTAPPVVLEAVVLTVGPGRMTEQGVRLPMELKVGDTVLYRRGMGQEIKVGDAPYLVLREAEVLAVQVTEE